MTLLWVFYALVVGVLVALAAHAAEFMRRNTGQSLRFVWAGGLALLLALILLAPARTQPVAAGATLTVVQGADLEGTATGTDADAGAVRTAMSSVRQTISRVQRTLAVPFEAVAQAIRRLPPAVDRAVRIAWLVSSLSALALLGMIFARTAKLRRQWPRTTLLGTEVRVAPDVGPAVMGVAPAEVVIPVWVLARTRDEQRLVLLHELQHLRAHDPWLLLFGCLCVALAPWHPAVWYMLARLRLALEMDCDARVLQSGATPPEYGVLLVELSGYRSLVGPLVPTLALNTSHLEQRLLAMTARPSRHRVVRRLVGGLVAGVAVLAACETTLPTTAEVESMNVAKAVAGLPMVDTTATYVVNGQVVSASAARAIPPESIAKIQLLRKSKTVLAGEVRVVKIMGETMLTGDVHVSKANGPGILLKSPDVTGVYDVVGVKLANNENQLVPVTQPAETPVALLRADSSAQQTRTFEGLIFVDGVPTSSMKLRALPRDDIESVEVIKGAPAKMLYSDPRAVNGVILITMKKR